MQTLKMHMQWVLGTTVDVKKPQGQPPGMYKTLYINNGINY